MNCRGGIKQNLSGNTCFELYRHTFKKISHTHIDETREKGVRKRNMARNYECSIYTVNDQGRYNLKYQQRINVETLYDAQGLCVKIVGGEYCFYCGSRGRAPFVLSGVF